MRQDYKIFFFCLLISEVLLFSGCNSIAKERSSEKSILEEIKELTGKNVITELNPQEYVNWVEDKNNGLIVSKKMGDFTFSAFYKPTNYLALVELGKDSINKKQMTKKLEEYEGLQYFTYRIESDNKITELLRVGMKSNDDYYSRIEYFSFKMQEDLKLIEDKDTLDCVLFHYERVYGLAPYASFVVGFPLSKESNNKGVNNYDKIISYTDKVFGTGKINMTVKNENIKSIPNLIIN